MDKTGIIVISICVLLLGWWFVEQKKFAEQQSLYQATNEVATAVANLTNAAAGFTPATASTATVTPTIFATNTPEQTLVLTNQRVRYTFTSRGGGLQLVELLDYPETVSARWKKTKSAADSVASLNTRAPLPVLAVTGNASLTGDGNFTLTRTADGVRAEKDLPDGLKLVKEFQLSSNYLVNASVRLENTTAQPLALPAQQVVVGTATPMDADDISFPTYGGTMWYDGTEPVDTRLAYFNPNPTVLGLFHRTVHTEYHAGTDNVLWAAVHNQYFALMTMTATNQPAQAVTARPVTLPAFPNVEEIPGAPLPRGVEMMLNYPGGTLSAHAVIDRRFVLFAGPKEYRTLAGIAETYHNHADLVMNFGTGFVSFWGIGTFFAKLLLSAMNGLHDLTRLSYGWTIVLITILIKALFWPLTAKATRSMKKMQALAPEVNALKEKYKDDQQKLMQKQMELWKKNKVNPMSGCLPMVIQMPVFIGFFIMIRSAIELRGAHWLWVADLSKPDTLFMIPGVNFPFNLLPLLMGGAMLWQSHLQPPSPGMDPAQQKMMRWMPAIFILFLYNYSSGLALYWTVNNILTVVQTKLTRTITPVTAAAPATNPALTPASKKKK
jgi:YidC/Oxa1 family membrane protein insertase